MQKTTTGTLTDSGAKGASRNPAEWVDLHGDALFRFAILRVKDEHLAEDLVQETFLSALRAFDGFEGRSSLRTWLIGILKRKIIDHFRKTVVEIPEADLTLWEKEDDREFFDKEGHWKRPLRDWKESPERLVESGEFWETFQTCLSMLPESHRRAFTLRELDGYKNDEICKILSITPSNMWVMIHRARAKLRKCLDANWFLIPTEEKS
jgi:RNA polymerase sigma-70 factor (ECF subfamily)